jgi:hypothetical protein
MPIEPMLAEGLRERSGSPQTMAIGDSLFNGVRSLSIDRARARLAVPVMVAEGLGESPRVPDYPFPVLFDLETFIRQGFDLGRLREIIVSNADRWLEIAPHWSHDQHVFFDNIAIAGAEIRNLYEDRAGDYFGLIPSLLQQIKSAGRLPGEQVYALYYALNAAFLLNPSGKADLSDLTPLEQVALRRPKRLIVSIGSNEGLFRGCILGQFTETLKRSIEAIPDKMGVLADHMAAEFGADAVEHVYFTNLIKPSTVANVMPRTDPDELVGCGRYYPQYLSRLLGGAVGISEAQMRRFDQLIADVNARSQEIVTQKLAIGGRSVTFVDIYGMSSEVDGKHGCVAPGHEVKVMKGSTPWRLTNNPITTSLIFGFVRGGLFSLDNMHPTTVGYALLANKILDAIEANEGVAVQRVPLQAAFEADGLLQDIPRNYSILSAIVNLIGTFGFFGR